MIKFILLYFLDFYHKRITPILEIYLGKGCRFHPTCSQYARESIERYGVMRGILMSSRRLLRCHPYTKVSYDPVPINLTH